MFTGLIETIGTVSGLKAKGNYFVMEVDSTLPLDEIRLGDSISCNGACLTVVEVSGGSFAVEVSQETAQRVDMERYQPGRRVNLERALRVGDRMGGHFVSGHIDTAGQVASLRSVGRSLELAVRYDTRFDPLVIEKGSIAIDGVSLTVNECSAGLLSVNLIPHTSAETTLPGLGRGDSVNLEFDLIGKYVVRMKQSDRSSGVTPEKLLENGW